MVIHVVEKGDTLYKLGNEYGVDYKKIANDNEILLDETLVIGQTLVIINNPLEPKLGTMEVNGYTFPSINKDLLIKILPNLTYLSIFSYQVRANGNLITIDDSELIALAKEYNVAPVMVITNIGENGRFDSDIANIILSDVELQKQLISNIQNTMRSKGYLGIDVDFEYIYPEDREKYNNFLVRLESTLKADGFFVTTALAPKELKEKKGILYEAHDYNFHGQIADHVIIMTYEWGYQFSEPMAVAPIKNVENVIRYATSEIPSNKILMGIPNYGYDWEIPIQKGVPAKSIGNYDAVNLAREKNTSINYDTVSQAPFFNYKDGEQEHEVWFEDARSIEAKLKLASSYNLGGVSYWTIDRYFPQNWLVLSSLFNIKKII